MHVSRNTLVILAACVWYAGGFFLALKAGRLISAAIDLNPGILWPAISIMTGVSLGLVKARYLFIRACVKNINRIFALESPKVWEFYRLPFFFFLMLMIILGSYLSTSAHGNYSYLLSVAILDISIGVALLASSTAFWKRTA